MNRPAISSIINSYLNLVRNEGNSSKEPEFELGVRFSTDSSQSNGMKYLYSTLFNTYKENCVSIDIIEHLDIYYSNDVRKTMVFSKGVNQKKDIIMKKVSLERPFIISRSIKNVKDIKAKLSSEEIVNSASVSGSVRFMKFKLRVKFNYENDSTFGVELDLVKNVKPEADLKNIKASVFKNYVASSILNAIDFTLFDECRLEFELDNEKVKNILNSGSKFDVEDIFKPVNDLASFLNRGSGVDMEIYQKYIFSLARQIIGSNKGYLETFRFKSGLKKLLNNVIEMDSNIYFKQIQPEIINGNGFYITDKIDGKRSILMIKYEEGNESNSNIVVLNNTITFYSKIRANKDTKLSYITLDCELLEGEGLFCFDVITYNSNKYANKSFSERYEVMKEAVDVSARLLKAAGVDKLSIVSKDFILTTADSWREQIKTFYNNSLSKKYDIDGLIFTPRDSSNYSSMVGYKWKPSEHSTIDFFVKKVSTEILKTSPELFFNDVSKSKQAKELEENDVYVLFSGISKRDMDAFNIKLMPHYDNIVGKINTSNLIPVQFSTSDRPYNFIFRLKKDEERAELDGKIGEFGWDSIKNKWSLKKIRTDRDVELARGEYFGNYYKVAESIWYAINNPLTFENLLSVSENMYFMADNVDIYKEQRNYNSFVKTVSLQTALDHIAKEPIVLDLASGKGQDLARLAKLRVKDAIFVDNDKSALQELIRRKHSMSSIFKGNNSMKVTTCHADLNYEYKEIIKKVEESYGSSLKEGVDLVVCNFAIHYIAYSPDKLKNIINLISYFIKQGGLFVFTCFDGVRVQRLCSSNGWNAYTDNNLDSSVDKLKYSILPLFTGSDAGSGVGKVKLILPFSNGQYYEEELLNLESISKHMTDNGFDRETKGSFANLFSKYKNLDNLSEDDKTFTGLYSYNVYRKNKEYSDIIIQKTSITGSILYSLPEDEEKAGAADLSEETESPLDNVPLSNNITIISNYKGILSELAIKHISESLEKYGYRDYRNNSKIRKYVYIIGEDSDKYVTRFINTKGKRDGGLSIIIMDSLFSSHFEDYVQKLIKIPVNTIMLKGMCAVVDSKDYAMYKKNNLLEEIPELTYIQL